MNSLPKPVYVLSEPHLSGHRVVLGYEALTDAQDAHTALATLAHPPAQASETGGEVAALITAAKAVTMAAWTDRFGRLHGHETVAALERALAALSAPQAAPGEGEGES